MKKSAQYAVAAVIAIAAIAAHLHRQRSTTTAEPPAANQVALTERAKQFRIGSLDFSACELAQPRSAATTAAFCAPFQVPEDRANADGRRIDLKLALIRAESPVADGFVVFIAGGPGQSAINGWPQIAPALAPLRKNRHILLLDQRGVGGSNALTCDEVADGSGDDPALMEQRARDCLAKVSTHADPRQYTTTAAVADLEALRQALGGPTFDLVGVSYGTRVAQQYLMRHPEGVRSVVLDSVAPNTLVFGNDFARNLDDSLKAQFALCTSTPACHDALGDPMATLRQLQASLTEAPRTLTLHDPVDFGERTLRLDGTTLAGVVRLYAYTPETAALLPLILAEAAKGNFAPLLGQARLIAQGIEELSTSGMQLSVVCTEDADLLKPDPATADTTLGTAIVDALQRQCTIWPKGDRPADFHQPVHSDKPVLLLAGEFDPVTPVRYADEVAATLPNSRVIVAKGQGHNLIGRGCLPRVVDQFVKTLDAKGLDATCVDRLQPTPPFTTFSGATP